MAKLLLMLQDLMQLKARRSTTCKEVNNLKEEPMIQQDTIPTDAKAEDWALRKCLVW